MKKRVRHWCRTPFVHLRRRMSRFILIHMADLALWTVRILRWLPRTRRFDAHLTDCAALAVFYAPFDARIEPLRLAHIFRMTPLPNCFPGFSEGGMDGAEASVLTHGSDRSDMAQVILNRIHLVQSQTLH
jgi:hypothetical protein